MATCKHSTSIDLDYVEDSEPERKRVKLQVVESKKRRRHQKQFELGRQTAINAHVAGLDGVTAEATMDQIDSVVVDIIDDDDAKQSSSKPPSESPSPVPPEDSRMRASSPQLVPSADATTLEIPSESNIITCLGHLAYDGSSSNKSDSSRARRSRSTPTSEVHHGKIERRSRSFQPDSNVTKLDVGPLLGCVSCGVQWTVRKSVAHKLSHMMTCARKMGINPSTLDLLIEKELVKLRHSKKNDKKPPCSEPVNGVPQTYLESVVAEAQPRRKQRRTDAVGTLQPISQTRAAILDRAKALLGTQEAAPYSAPEPECTQSFGQSKLVTRHAQAENFDPMLAHPSEESVLTSRLALLRSMAESPTTYPP